MQFVHCTHYLPDTSAVFPPQTRFRKSSSMCKIMCTLCLRAASAMAMEKEERKAAIAMAMENIVSFFSSICWVQLGLLINANIWASLLTNLRAGVFSWFLLFSPSHCIPPPSRRIMHHQSSGIIAISIHRADHRPWMHRAKRLLW